MKKLMLLTLLLSSVSFAAEHTPMSPEEFEAMSKAPFFISAMSTLTRELGKNARCSSGLNESEKFKKEFPDNNWEEVSSVEGDVARRTMVQGCRSVVDGKLAIVKVVGFFKEGKNGLALNVTSVEVERNYILE
ncbi:MAG: hypothetical protein V4596_12940 [Bdellovibrionota bacterium]